MKRLFAVAISLATIPVAWSANTTTQEPTDVMNGTTLAKNLFCQTYTVLTGQFGLLLGFAMALYGLYILINTQKMYGLWVIACGALLTALPGILVTMAQGFWTLTSSLHGNGSLPIPSC